MTTESSLPKSKFALRDFPDHAIRKLLEYPQHLRSVVAAAAPRLVSGFDFERMEPASRDFLLEDWREREADHLFLVPFAADGEPQSVLVCVLLEHQSQPDRVMPLRMLACAALYWEQQWKQWQAADAPREPLRLTPVLPIVFHTGGTRWRDRHTMADLIDCPESLKAYAPVWL